MDYGQWKQVRAGWCALVARFPWSLFGTLTTREEWQANGLERATHRFLDSYSNPERG